MTDSSYSYYTYTPNELSSIKNSDYIGMIMSALTLDGGTATRLSPRSFQIKYDDPEMNKFCRYDIFQRAAYGHLTLKVNLVLADGSVFRTARYIDITVDSFVVKMQSIFDSVKNTRATAQEQLDTFISGTISGMSENGFICLGQSKNSLAFKGKRMGVTITVSPLGMFTAMLLSNQRTGKPNTTYKIEDTVSAENSALLCKRVADIADTLSD